MGYRPASRNPVPNRDVEFADLLSQLFAAATPRPDLITPGATGALENARPVTFAGRVAYPGETAADVLSRMPSESPEEGGRVLGKAAPMALGLKSLTKSEQESLAKLIKHLQKTGETIPKRNLKPVVETHAGKQVIGDVGNYHSPLYELLSPEEIRPIGVPGNLGLPLHGFKTSGGHRFPDVLIPYGIADMMERDPETISLIADMIRGGRSVQSIADIFKSSAVGYGMSPGQRAMNLPRGKR